MVRRLEVSPVERAIIEAVITDREGREVARVVRGPHSGQVSAVSTVPIYAGSHSEAQILSTLAPGDILTATVRPIGPYGILLSGFQADAEPDKIYCTAYVHPDIAPHSGYLNPALVKIVHDNLRTVLPLIKRGAVAKFTFENKDSVDQELEVVVGLIIGFVDALERIRRLREV